MIVVEIEMKRVKVWLLLEKINRFEKYVIQIKFKVAYNDQTKKQIEYFILRDVTTYQN
jgi:hypothetical protein